MAAVAAPDEDEAAFRVATDALKALQTACVGRLDPFA
jgi:hypothetical protein